MFKKKKPTEPAADSAAPAEAPVRMVYTDADKENARAWFAKAKAGVETRSYDYAIEYYAVGLKRWPDAVEEGLGPLHYAAVARQQAGGAKPGMMESMKRSTTGKDPHEAFENSLWLFGRDPETPSNIEAVFRNALRLTALDAAMWAATVYFKVLENTQKPSAKLFRALVEGLEELSDIAGKAGAHKLAQESLEWAIRALNLLSRKLPKENVDNAVKDLSSKMTIVRGRYSTGESYRDSIADAQQTADVHDEQRLMLSAERTAELLDKATAAYEAAPQDATKIKAYVDQLTMRGNEEDETRAIGVCVEAFKTLGDYRWKVRADDIYIKQLERAKRLADKTGDANAMREAREKKLRYELKVYGERLEKYPTDNRVRFTYAIKLFEAGRFDDAIPKFQTARTDPKNRTACDMYLGRCFFRKGYFGQAIHSLEEAIKHHEHRDDELAKGMLYWLGRSQEGEKLTSAARATYGRLLQIDYNYRDVRQRLDAMPQNA